MLCNLFELLIVYLGAARDEHFVPECDMLPPEIVPRDIVSGLSQPAVSHSQYEHALIEPDRTQL